MRLQSSRLSFDPITSFSIAISIQLYLFLSLSFYPAINLSIQLYLFPYLFLSNYIFSCLSLSIQLYLFLSLFLFDNVFIRRQSHVKKFFCAINNFRKRKKNSVQRFRGNKIERRGVLIPPNVSLPSNSFSMSLSLPTHLSIHYSTYPKTRVCNREYFNFRDLLDIFFKKWANPGTD